MGEVKRSNQNGQIPVSQNPNKKIAPEATKMFNPEIGPLLAWSINPTLLGIPVQNLPIYACAALVGYVLWRIARVQNAE